MCLAAGLCHAQDAPQSVAAPPPATVDAPPVEPASTNPQKEAEERRMFGIVPNFKTVNDPSLYTAPIGPKEKFGLVLHYFDPFTFAISSVQSGIEQATNAKREYGQGSLGYAKRYGADFTDAFTNELFVVGVFPSLMHEDPRYFRLGQGGGWRRTRYALSRVLIARTDSGGRRLNTSEFLGNFVSGALSQTYYPPSERGFASVGTRMGVQLGYDALFNILKEFYPDLKRKFRRK